MCSLFPAFNPFCSTGFAAVKAETDPEQPSTYQELQTRQGGIENAGLRLRVCAPVSYSLTYVGTCPPSVRSANPSFSQGKPCSGWPPSPPSPLLIPLEDGEQDEEPHQDAGEEVRPEAVG